MSSQWQTCRKCETLQRVEVFPALFRESAPGQSGEAILIEGESSCFYHPEKRATLPCQNCGRFVCALCDCALHGQHFCPACLEVGRTKGKIKNLENHRTLYDTIALALAVVPIITLFFWFATIITAPAAFFTAIWYWNAPTSIVRRTKIRYMLAIFLSVVEMAGWFLFIYSLVEPRRV